MLMVPKNGRDAILLNNLLRTVTRAFSCQGGLIILILSLVPGQV
jgi:hypothetical protein